MLNTEGMTPQGIERKATCQNLFRKLLYLTEYEPLVRRAGGAEVATDLRKVRGGGVYEGCGTSSSWWCGGCVPVAGVGRPLAAAGLLPVPLAMARLLMGRRLIMGCAQRHCRSSERWRRTLTGCAL